MAELDILEEAYETAKIYKATSSSGGGWDSDTDPPSSAWEYVQDVQIYIEPTTPNDSKLNDQNYQGGVYKGILPISYDGVLAESYGLIDSHNESYIVVGKPQPFRFIIPHMECVLKSRQFTVNA